MKKIVIPSERVESEITVKKSKFISILMPVSSDGEVRRQIRELRSTHPDSSHVVWAFIVGDSGSLLGMSDDGEPHGTAGRPVLEVLKGSGLSYAALFVIRYFGGIKLGTGGLVSAYTRAAQDVLSLCDIIEKIDYVNFSLNCSYSQYEGVRAVLKNNEVQEEIENFGETVDIRGKIPVRNSSLCRQELADYSKGSLILRLEED